LNDQDFELVVEAPDGPVRQGLPTVVSVRVENRGPGALALERAWGDGPHDGAIAWGRTPTGVTVYDARQDCYRYRTGFTTSSQVPFCAALVPAGGACEALLPLKSLELGTRRVVVRARGVRVDEAELGRRVYVARDELQGAVVELRPHEAGAPFPTGLVIVHTRGCRPAEAGATLEVEAIPDEGSPAERALAQVGPGAALVDRCRALGAAWVIRDAGGALQLARGEQVLRLGPVGPGLWSLLDAALPFEPVRVRLVGAAAALEGSGEVPLRGPKGGEQQLERRATWELLAACAARGLRVEPAEHTTITQGLRVRPAAP
jgi:hypothetical protein